MVLDQILTKNVVTVEIDATVLEVARLVRAEGVGSAVVLDASGSVAGIVTDRDLVVYGQNFVDSLDSTVINDVMSPVVFTVTADTDVLELTARMREEGVRRVPVVSDGELVGIVTLDDVLVRLSEELRNLAAVVESASPDRA